MLVGPFNITFLDSHRRVFYDILHYRYKKHMEYRANHNQVITSRCRLQILNQERQRALEEEMLIKGY